MTGIALAFDALVVTSIADAVTTRLGMRYGAVEINPFMRWSTRSMERALLTKALGLVIIGTVLISLHCTHPLLALGVTWFGAGATARLAWRNWQIYRRLAREAAVTVSSRASWS